MTKPSLALGKHTFVDLYECNKDLLNNIKALEELMLEAAKIAKATIIKSHFHQFSPQGISGSVIIAESHFNIHSWPEFGYAAVDLFTCGDTIDEAIATELLVRKLESGRHEVKTIQRGLIPNPV